MTEEKKKAIQSKIKKGYPIGELKAELRKEGYTEIEINNSIGIHKANMKSWYLFFGILFFLFSVLLFVMDKAAIGIIITMVMGVWLLYSYNKELNKSNRKV
jgi:positive regulator of sigma E activity